MSETQVPDLYTDEVVWAFADFAESESWQGPYPTRKEATTAAIDAECAFICEARWISPAKVAAQAVDVGWLIDRMEETDFICGTFDEAIFGITPANDAEAAAALGQALSEWAEKWIDSQPRFMCIGEPVRVSEPA